MKRLDLRHTRRLSRGLAAGLLAFVLFGCGKSEEKFVPVPVSGKVTHGKSVVPMGTITFNPDAGKGNTSVRAPQAQLQTDGTYKLTTFTPNGEVEGAPPGWYKVTITEGGMSDPAQMKAKMPYIDSRYSSPQSTPFSVEIKEGAPAGAYDFKLQN